MMKHHAKPWPPRGSLLAAIQDAACDPRMINCKRCGGIGSIFVPCEGHDGCGDVRAIECGLCNGLGSVRKTLEAAEAAGGGDATD